jgi:hypothetical protein
LTAEFGRGFTATNLRHMRAFFVAFPIQHSLRSESGPGRKLSQEDRWIRLVLDLLEGDER